MKTSDAAQTTQKKRLAYLLYLHEKFELRNRIELKFMLGDSDSKCRSKFETAKRGKFH